MLNSARQLAWVTLVGAPELDHESLCVLQSLRHELRIVAGWLRVIT